jgi:uncharacterized membrane protein YqjE
LELLQVRLELLSIEAQEEVQRVIGLLLFGAVALLALTLGVVFLAILVTVALWDSHRLVVLAVFSVLFLTLGGVAAYVARSKVLAGSALFASSVEELRRDRESLKP